MFSINIKKKKFHSLVHLKYGLWGNHKLDVLESMKEIAKHVPIDKIS